MTAVTTCPTCSTTYTRPTAQTASDALWACHQRHRHDTQTPIVQLPQVTFREQALTAILALAITGKPFTECIPPVYAEWVGRRLFAVVNGEVVA